MPHTFQYGWFQSKAHVCKLLTTLLHIIVFLQPLMFLQPIHFSTLTFFFSSTCLTFKTSHNLSGKLEGAKVVLVKDYKSKSKDR